jgi:two-component system, OmpR family, sensor histidine kinase KdpD
MQRRVRRVVALTSLAYVVLVPTTLIASGLEIRLGFALLTTLPGVVGVAIALGPLAGVVAAIGSTLVNDTLFFGEGITDERTVSSLLVGPLLATVVGTYAGQVQRLRETSREREQEHERTRRADSSRVALLATLSHDMKTPLAAIKTMVSAMSTEPARWSPTDTREALTLIEEQADRLTNLVSNLLDMSRLQARALALDLQPTDAPDAIRRAAKQVALTPGYRLDPSLPLVLADDYLLERVLANLLLNVRRHAGPLANCRITALGTGERVIIEIEDDGGAPGDQAIPLPRAPIATGLTTQPPSAMSSLEAGGARGLAVCTALMEAMGGSLDIDRSDLGGWRVSLTVPMWSPVEAGEDSAGHRPVIGPGSGLVESHS